MIIVPPEYGPGVDFANLNPLLERQGLRLGATGGGVARSTHSQDE
jgi:hypothetical protein